MHRTGAKFTSARANQWREAEADITLPTLFEVGINRGEPGLTPILPRIHGAEIGPEGENCTPPCNFQVTNRRNWPDTRLDFTAPALYKEPLISRRANTVVSLGALTYGHFLSPRGFSLKTKKKRAERKKQPGRSQRAGAIVAQDIAAAGAEIHLQEIFDAVNVCLLLVDQNGVVKRANDVMSRWLGKGCTASGTDQPGDFLGCIHTLAAPAKCGHTSHCAACPIRHTFETVLCSGQPIHDVETEARLLCGGKEVRLWLTVSADPLVIAGQRHTILALNNITELRLAQQREMKALAEVLAAKTARETIAAMDESVVLMNTAGRITAANPALERLLGLSAAEIIGRNLADFLPTIIAPDDLAAVAGNLRDLTSGNLPEVAPFAIRSKDGNQVHVILSAAFIRSPNGAPVSIVITLRDISRLKAIEAQMIHYQDRLRSLANKLATTEEQERRRLARQIHDTVIQNLSLSAIKLGSIAQAVGNAALPDEQARLKTVRELIDEAIDQCRRLMADLTPSMLYELGLESALDDLARKIHRQHGVSVRLTNDGASKHLSGAMRGLLFQSTRELILNALKHAGPCQIEVITQCQGDQIHIRVVDNGAGFDPVKPHRQTEGIQGGFGLFHIQERVENLGGRFAIHSQPGQGTVATITLPLTAGREVKGNMSD